MSASTDLKKIRGKMAIRPACTDLESVKIVRRQKSKFNLDAKRDSMPRLRGLGEIMFPFPRKDDETRSNIGNISHHQVFVLTVIWISTSYYGQLINYLDLLFSSLCQVILENREVKTQKYSTKIRFIYEKVTTMGDRSRS